MKYVTFYWSVMGGIKDVLYHKNEADAMKHFRKNYAEYFPIHERFLPKKTPCAYGFPFRKYMAMTVRDFKTHWDAGEGR